MGASIDHIRLISTPEQEDARHAVAYAILTDPVRRDEYVTAQSNLKEDGKDWGKRGRERCSCGVVLGSDDEWNCKSCWGKLDYLVALSPLGAQIISCGGEDGRWVPTERLLSERVDSSCSRRSCLTKYVTYSELCQTTTCEIKQLDSGSTT